MICIIAGAYFLSLLVDCFAGLDSISMKSRKGVFIFSIVFILLILCYHKYLEMVRSLWHILKGATSIKSLILDLLRYGGGSEGMLLALSFVSFGCISYVMDVYKKEIPVERNFICFALYNLLFFKLVQGPIMKYSAVRKQLERPSVSSERVLYGLSRFSMGLGKKVLIANTLSSVVNQVWLLDAKETGTLALWITLLLYTLQIYYDFSGYSDMAVGLGAVFGFMVEENFNYPYTSLSIQEFWRRWHISLSMWFRDYVYIPLGGNRKGMNRTLFNLLIVFLLTGIWHGAGLNYIAWGLYYAFFSILERLFFSAWLKKNPVKILNWIYTMLVVMVGWVFFRSPNLLEALRYFKYLFVYRRSTGDISILGYFNMNVLFAAFFGLLLSGWLQRLLIGFKERHEQIEIMRGARVVLSLLVLILSIFMLVNGSYNPSIYAVIVK